MGTETQHFGIVGGEVVAFRQGPDTTQSVIAVLCAISALQSLLEVSGIDER